VSWVKNRRGSTKQPNTRHGGHSNGSTGLAVMRSAAACKRAGASAASSVSRQCWCSLLPLAARRAGAQAMAGRSRCGSATSQFDACNRDRRDQEGALRPSIRTGRPAADLDLQRRPCDRRGLVFTSRRRHIHRAEPAINAFVKSGGQAIRIVAGATSGGLSSCQTGDS
jgi:hypothetical protein